MGEEPGLGVGVGVGVLGELPVWLVFWFCCSEVCGVDVVVRSVVLVRDSGVSEVLGVL